MEEAVNFITQLFTIADTLNLMLDTNLLNDMNMSPVDVAVELKQNRALEFVIYSNMSLNTRFDLNNNANNRGFTPLHRAVIGSNYNAI